MLQSKIKTTERRQKGQRLEKSGLHSTGRSGLDFLVCAAEDVATESTGLTSLRGDAVVHQCT